MPAPKYGDPVHNFRYPEELHRRAMARAEAEGKSLSEVIRQFLERYAPADSESLLKEMFPKGK